MTVRNYGRVTPLQAMMLGLGGEVLDWSTAQPTDKKRIREMKLSRKELREMTGQDFGYDLGAWHQYLLKSEEYAEEYTFRYSWKAVQKKINELMQDPKRLELVRMIEADGGK
jgi:hypothetical protein